MSAPLHYVYNALTGTFDLTGGSGGGGSGITSVTATNAGGSIFFDTAGTVTNLETTDANYNTFLGEDSGNTTLTGQFNAALGRFTLHNLTTGFSNTAMGHAVLASLVDGNGNVGVGESAFLNLISGIENIGFGTLAGTTYTSNESYNILIGSQGALNDNNVIRVGADQTTAFFAGITSTLLDYNSLSVAIDSTTNQLGYKTFTDALANTFLGNTAGNGTLSGIANTGMGQGCMAVITTGVQNSGYGNGSLLALDTGSTNSAFGYFSLADLVDGSGNSAFGWSALANNISGAGNTGIGNQALQLATGNSNSAVGSLAGAFLTSGNQNCMVGEGSLGQLMTGSNNLAFGVNAGHAYTGAETGNICIDNLGVAAESNVTRIGTDQTSCYIQGINGASVTGTAVLCAADGQLGTVVSSIRYKENVQDIAEDVSVLNLRPVSFNYKADEKKEIKYGLIAEEVEKDFPYLCFYKDEKPDSVKYQELCTFLLLEIQRIDKRLKILEKN